LTALQRARFETLVEKVRKTRGAMADYSREELVLAAVEELVADRSPESTSESSEDNAPTRHDCTRVHPTTPYQIVIHRCDKCQTATLPTAAGRRRLSLAETAAIACDARVLELGRRNRSTIPPAMRRAVLARDGHGCQVPGCRHVQFLEVHHIVPRLVGGDHSPENLVTICSSCHRLLHKKKLEVTAWRSRDAW
jgi:5-methylcytosine-specific restriction endonuclease McrA